MDNQKLNKNKVILDKTEIPTNTSIHSEVPIGNEVITLESINNLNNNSNFKEEKSFFELDHIIEIKEQIGNIFSHTIVILFALLSIYLVHISLDRLLGKDAILLDIIKVKHIIDAGDLMVLLSWLLVVILNSYKIVWKTLKKK